MAMGVSTSHEGICEVGLLFIKMLGGGDTGSSRDKSFKDNVFMSEMVLRIGMKISISVSFFMIHLVGN